MGGFLAPMAWAWLEAFGTMAVIVGVILVYLKLKDRAPNPLPGSLCDEQEQRLVADGPDPLAGEWQPRGDGEVCPHCDPGMHQNPATRRWAVWISSNRDRDGQPTRLCVAVSNGAHVAESDAEWLRQVIRLATSHRNTLADEKHQKLEVLYLQTRQQLREMTEDRDRLELTLDRRDEQIRQLKGTPDAETVTMPRVRSLTPGSKQ